MHLYLIALLGSGKLESPIIITYIIKRKKSKRVKLDQSPPVHTAESRLHNESGLVSKPHTLFTVLPGPPLFTCLMDDDSCFYAQHHLA